MPSPRTLHIANGTSVTETLDPIAVPGVRMIWCDPLHDGPVPADVSQVADAAQDDEVILWYEHDLDHHRVVATPRPGGGVAPEW